MNLNKSNVILINGETDEQKVSAVRQLAAKPMKGKMRRHVCLQVSSQQLLRQLQTQDMGDGIAERLELHPYSFEELWAQKLFVSLPRRRVVASPLDWRPVYFDSNYRVHLVVFGMNSMTEALVRQACLVCHYPNYLRDANLKTRITIIDSSIKEDDNLLLRRYRTLFDYCNWSYVDKYGCEKSHKPECGYLGGEFTDVEFRFVAAESSNTVVRVMMAEFARNANELVTIVYDGDDGEANWDMATGLPAEYYMEGCDIPIYVRMKSTMMLGSPTLMPQYRNIKPFGMDDCEYDLSLPLTQMAMGVSFLYNHCSTTGEVVCGEVDRRLALELWNKEKAVNRFSSEALAMTIITKMRSRGKAMDEPLTDNDIAIMAEVEHNRWSVERLMSGVRPVTPDEQKAIDKDRSLKKKMRDRGAHYDLRPYNMLKEDFAGHNVQMYDEALIRGLQPIVEAFEKHDTGPKMVVVKRETNSSAKYRLRTIMKWGAAAVAVLMLAAVIGYLWFNNNNILEDDAREAIGKYVYVLRIDSIEVWNGNRGIDKVLRKSDDNYVGTAFAVDGVGIVTARHCVEYWLYDKLSVLNDSTQWTEEMRMAVEVETYNDTTRGEKKRMVSVCSLFASDGSRVMDRVVFDINQSRDKIRSIGKKKWRYVVPVFERDRDMLLSDYALFAQADEKGIKLASHDGSINKWVCMLGYPNIESTNRTMVCNARRVENADEGTIRLRDKASHGISGGPIVQRRWFHFEAVGIMSRNDKDGSENSWATIINLDNK